MAARKGRYTSGIRLTLYDLMVIQNGLDYVAAPELKAKISKVQETARLFDLKIDTVLIEVSEAR